MSLTVVIQILFFGGKEREKQKETKIQDETELMRSKSQTSITTRVYPTSTNTLDCETGNNIPGTLMNSEIRDEDGDIESRRKSHNSIAPDTPKSIVNTKGASISPRSPSESGSAQILNNSDKVGNIEGMSSNMSRRESGQQLIIDPSPRYSMQGFSPKRSFHVQSPKIVRFGSARFLSRLSTKTLPDNNTNAIISPISHSSSLNLEDSNVSKTPTKSSKLPPMTFGYIFVVYIYTIYYIEITCFFISLG